MYLTASYGLKKSIPKELGPKTALEKSLALEKQGKNLQESHDNVSLRDSRKEKSLTKDPNRNGLYPKK